MAIEQAPAAGDIKTALVVDDDEVARNLIANYLRKAGIEDVEMCEDGDAGWRRLRERRFDFLVLDWKLPGLSGLGLFNRIRRLKDYRHTPLLVVSGFLEKDDFRLLQEFPCTALMEKPFTNALFDNKLEELRRESTWYLQNVALVDTILDAVEHDQKRVETLLAQVLKKAPNPLPLALVAARRLVRAGLDQSAEKVLRGVLKIDEGSVIAMNELGKALHRQGRHEEALDVLRRASRLSPQNLQRLCLLGEVELNLQDPEAAKAYFEQALAIDSDDHTAQAGVVVADNMLELAEAAEKAEELEESATERLAMAAGADGDMPQSFASIMNTMGITFVRNGQYQRGIDQYRAAMTFLRSRTDSARVAFNVGLGYMRWGKASEALSWFQKSEELGDAAFAKSARYVTKLVANGGAQATAEVAFAQIDSGKVAGGKSGSATARAPAAPAATVTDDAGEASNVIPFPTPAAAPKGPSAEPPAAAAAAGKKGGDEPLIEEESVGSAEMVLRSALDAEARAARGAGDATAEALTGDADADADADDELVTL